VDPFDLRGPEFLLFYAVLGACTVAVVWGLRRFSEGDQAASSMLNSYLDIAYLRGGSNEALRVATMNLVNRGLIDVNSDDTLQTIDREAGARVSRMVERRILERFQTRDAAPAIFSDRRLQHAAKEDCEPTLTRLGVLPDGGAKSLRGMLLFTAVLVLVSVAAIKVYVAVSRGRSNVLLLCAEAVVLCVLAYKATHPFRTPAGDALLADLRTLFGGLRDRAHSLARGVQTEDFALLMALYGMAALPPSFSFGRLFPKAQGTSSCGSGCGSGGGSGGSCGGGSCGGGCGGCGS
jgi:uncharacterized protein (TIGR04222 family)